MQDAVVERIVDEGTWPAVAFVLAFLVVGVGLRRRLAAAPSRRAAVVWAMSRFYGCLLGVLGLAHLLAVTVKLGVGTLEGNLALLLGIGVVLAAPSIALFARADRYLADVAGHRREIARLNVVLALALVAFGLPNAPLAVLAGLNVAYLHHRRPAVGWSIVAVAALGGLALLAGSLVFLASGQSFERFQGME